jgi:hypothetical protein
MLCSASLLFQVGRHARLLRCLQRTAVTVATAARHRGWKSVDVIQRAKQECSTPN